VQPLRERYLEPTALKQAAWGKEGKCLSAKRRLRICCLGKARYTETSTIILCTTNARTLPNTGTI
jgi:hypothetical protein